MVHKLSTVAEVVEALGGPTKIKAMFGFETHTTACMWVARDRIPAMYRDAMTEALRKAGKTAPPKLWGMVAP